jgi:hypothetical protein
MKSSLIESSIPWAKNYFINGAFDLWQRGTSGTAAAVCTRWVSVSWVATGTDGAGGLGNGQWSAEAKL